MIADHRVHDSAREELTAHLSGCSPSLPTSEELLAAARISGDESLSRILQAVQVVVLIAHDTATYTAADAFSLDVTTKIWLRLDEVYGWARNTLFAVYAPELVGHGLIRVSFSCTQGPCQEAHPD